MNIIYDYQIFSWQKYGGVSRYFYEIANRMAALPEAKVEIFSPLYVTEFFRNKCNVRPRGVKTGFFWGFERITLPVNRTLTRLLVTPRRDVDIFHETSYSTADCCPASAKRIITVYDMIHEKFSQYFADASEARRTKSHAIHRADHVICISESTKRDLMELLAVPEEKISVVYLSNSLSPSGKGEKTRTSKGAGGKPFILFVGARRGYKNFEGLLRAYAGSPLLRDNFSLVCFGGSGFSTNESALIRSLHVQPDGVRQVSGDDGVLASLYTSAAAFVCPSLYEGFGIPLLEAMSLGCPVVCSNTSSIPEVVGDAAEMFDPSDPSAMQAAIERVVSKPEYATTLSERGRKRAGLFSWDKCAADTLAVYKNTLQA